MGGNILTRGRKKRLAAQKAPEIELQEGTSSKRAKLMDGTASTSSSPPRNALLEEVAKALEAGSGETQSVEEARHQETVDSSQELLVKVPRAEVQLLEQGNDRDVELATGELEITRIVQAETTVAVFARVGDDFQWPLAKDAPVVKVDELHYIFTLKVRVSLEEEDGSRVEEEVHVKAEVAKVNAEVKPDTSQVKAAVLNYGVTFPEGTDKELLSVLDKVIEKHSSLVRLQSERKEQATPAAAEPAKNAPSPWWFNQQVIPNLQHEYKSGLARAIALGSFQIVQGILWASDLVAGQIERSGFLATKHIKPSNAPSTFSPETMKNIQKAKKVSKMTSSLAENILSGVVTATGSITSTMMNTPAGVKFLGMLPGDAALATLDAFVNVFDALEMAGKNVLSTTSLVTCQVVQRRFGEQAAAVAKQSLATAGHVIATAWTISKIRTAIDPRNVPRSSVVLRSTAEELRKKSL